MSTRAAKHSLAWLSSEMLCQSAAATLLACAVYVAHGTINFPLSDGVGPTGHLLTGTILGLLLAPLVALIELGTLLEPRHGHARRISVRWHLRSGLIPI